MKYSHAKKVDKVASIDPARITEHVQDANMHGTSPGICLECDIDHFGIEPDAEYYECLECGKKAVFGAEQLLIYMQW
jgi:ferredoxin-like protein FixX